MRFAIAAFGLMLAAAPAAAQEAANPDETYTEKVFGDWRVYGFEKACWFVLEADGGELDLSTSPDEPELYVSLANPAWTDLDSDAEYKGRVRFGTLDRELSAMGLFSDGKGGAMLVDGDDDSWLGALAAAPSIRVEIAGHAIERPLAGAGEAIAYMRACTRASRAKAG